MTNTIITIRGKGQITLPTDIRRALGWHEGDRVVAVLRGDSVVLERPEKSVTRVYGALSDYAHSANRGRTIQEIIDDERDAFEQAVVEDVLDELDRR